MITRGSVSHQYGQHPADYSPPPFHASMHEHQYPQAPDRARLYAGGGLMGGRVNLTAAGPTGMRLGNTGYGYLGMDPSDPTTWPRPFVPSSGMISFLNFGAVC